MRRPPARRPRGIAGALTALAVLGSCADDGPDDPPVLHVVDVAARPCDRPLPSEGVGVVLGDGLVVTAAHVVEGPRREVTVDGLAAAVVAVDHRTDLALLVADVPGGAVLTDVVSDELRVVTPTGSVPVDLVRTGTLIVDDATDRARYERDVHTVRPAVAAGTSGAPLVDASGRVLGIVVLANRRDDTSYAVTSGEVGAVRDAAGDPGGDGPRAGAVRTADVTCPG
jgi:S1-C subfamily serine protease